MLDAANSAREAPAAVRKRPAQTGQLVKHAAEDERANCVTRLGRHRDQPGQPVFAVDLPTDHVPRVHEDTGVELLALGEDGQQLGCLQRLSEVMGS